MKDRLGTLTSNQRRAIIALIAIPFFFTALNYYLDWGLLGEHAKQALGAWLLILILALINVAPTPDEIREYNWRQKHPPDDG